MISKPNFTESDDFGAITYNHQHYCGQTHMNDEISQALTVVNTYHGSFIESIERKNIVYEVYEATNSIYIAIVNPRAYTHLSNDTKYSESTQRNVYKNSQTQYDRPLVWRKARRGEREKLLHCKFLK